MNFTIALEQEPDDTWTAEVMELPGAIAAAVEPRVAVRLAAAFALRIVAERLQFCEIEEQRDGGVEVQVTVNVAARIALATYRSKRAIEDRVSPEVLEQVAANVLDPVRAATAAIGNSFLESLDGSWQPLPARRVYQALLREGWSETRRSSSHVTLSKVGSPDFVFGFSEGELIRPRLLSRIAAHTGLTPDDVQR